MRTTLDLPDPLLRRLKARAALEGLSMKDLLERYVTAGLLRSEAPRSERADGGRVSEADTALERSVSAFDVMQDGAGIARGGERDLATHPRHMEGFGR